MELADMADNHRIKEWSLAWPGADPAVPPCMQTVGTTKKGMMRWNTFVRDRKGLAYYAGKRYVGALELCLLISVHLKP
jgi:hypothetical protein